MVRSMLLLATLWHLLFGAVGFAMQMPLRDVVIVGSGPAGCTAGLYCARALLKPLVLGGYASGGQLMLTSDVENYPGYKEAVPGPKLIEDLRSQAQRFGAEFKDLDVKSVDFNTYPFKLTTDEGEIRTKSVIVATGANALWLNAKDEEKFRGKGISSCATCDGALFRNKDVVVVGGGDSAMEEAQFLTRFASKVTLLHRRDKFRASKTMLKRVLDNKKIEVKTFKRVNRWLGGENGLLVGAEVADTRDESTEVIPCEGGFIAIGHKPNTGFLGNQIELDEEGYIKTVRHTMTSKPGVFACGDVVDKRYRQAITAAGQGCAAALDCEKWLEEQAAEHSS